MNALMLSVIVVIISMCYRTINGEETCAYVRMENIYIDHSYSSVTTTSVMGCCAVCSENDRCTSITFSTNVCNLNERNPTDFPDSSLVSSISWTSYRFEPAPCPTPWYLYNRHCYLVVGTEMTWSNAQSNCQSFGGQLIELDDAAESNYVMNLFETVNGPVSGYHTYWLGINDMANNGNFVFPSGDPVTYLNFNVVEPSNGAGEDCVASYATEDWNDTPCSYFIRSVCEKFHY